MISAPAGVVRGFLALETVGPWGFSADVTVAGNTDTWTVAPTIADPASAMDDLVTWCNALLRPWWGGVTFGWTATAYSGTGLAAVALTSAGQPFDWLPDADCETVLGIHAENNTYQNTLTDGAQGSFFPAAGVTVDQWVRNLGDGNAAGIGAIRGGVPGLAGFAPKVEAVATASEVAVLIASLRYATRPRRAMLWQPHTGQWRQAAIGQVSHGRGEGAIYRIKVAARGEP